MAAKNSNEEDLMLRLTNHINGISLILDIVDVNSFPEGSRLQKVIARQLIDLRGRINRIPAVTEKGLPVPKNPCQQPPPKNAVKFAPSIPKQPTLQEQGWHILKKERETENFELESDNNFFCLLCGCSMHTNNLLGHIRGKSHHKHFEDVSEEEEEAGEYCDDGEEDEVDWMMDEMEDCDNERRIELMWDIVYATDNTIDNILPSDKWFYCRLCSKTLNGPFPVVDHVRGSAHQSNKNND